MMAATTRRFLHHLRPLSYTSQLVRRETVSSTLPFSILPKGTKEETNQVNFARQESRIGDHTMEHYNFWERINLGNDKNIADRTSAYYKTTKYFDSPKKNSESMAENSELVMKLDSTCRKLYARDKLMADNLEIAKELEFVLWKIDENDKLIAENSETVRELEYENEELMASNLAQVKKLDFSFGFDAKDKLYAKALELARGIDRATKKIDVNDGLMPSNMEPDFVSGEIDVNDQWMPNNSDVIGELDFTPEEMDVNEELMADNLEPAKKLDHAIRKINANNKRMAFNEELNNILSSINKKLAPEDELTDRIVRTSRDELNEGLIAENLEIVRKLDFSFENIDVNDKWIADNLALIRKLDFTVGQVTMNDQLIKMNLELVRKCDNENDELKADNLDLIRKSQVTFGKINANDKLMADNLDQVRKSQVVLGNSENDKVTERMLGLPWAPKDANNEWKADNLDLVREPQVALGKNNEGDDLMADNL